MAARSGALEISIYDEIGFYGVNASDFKRSLDGFENVDEIVLNLHSPGGSVFDGLAIYNQLKNHDASVTVHIDGLAASIASIIAMAGDNVVIPENAFIMIHKPRMPVAGVADELRESADLLDKVETTLLAAYRGKTGITDERLAPMLEAETWLTGVEAVELGFADHLAEPIKAVAVLQSGLIEGFTQMPNKAKELIGGENATDPKTNAPAPVATPEPVAVAPVAEPVAVATPAPVATVADFRAAEQARRQGVTAVFSDFAEYGDLRAECLDDLDCSAEQARAKLLAGLAAQTTPSAAQIHAGNGAIVRDSIENSIASRVGLVEAEAGNAFRAMTLLDLARASLVENGTGVAGLSRMDLVAAAFTHSTGDFGSVMADVASKSMLKGFMEADETFQAWTATGSLSDFKVNSRVDLSNFPSLREVKEGAEYKSVTTTDRAETIMLATYGEKFSITRQAIINDDLSVFDRIPRLMGRAAIRTIGDLVYAVLTGNPSLSDGVALFHANHSNIYTGAFGVAALDGAKSQMATQKEGNASLNIRPSYLLTPVAREAVAKAYLGAEYDPDLADARVPNPVRNLVDVIADARLDDDSTTTSYMVGSASQYDTIEVAYLDGNQSPMLEQMAGWSVDGTEFKVRIDAGVAPLGYRAMQKLVDS